MLITVQHSVLVKIAGEQSDPPLEALVDDATPWYQVDLGEVRQVSAIQINLADHQMPAQDIPAEQMVPNQLPCPAEVMKPPGLEEKGLWG